MCTHTETQTLNPLPSNEMGSACPASSSQQSCTLWTQSGSTLLSLHPDSFQEHSALPPCAGAHAAPSCCAPKWHSGIVPSPCVGAAALGLSGSILVVSGLHQEGLQVLTLQQGPSFLWLCLFQGFIAIWDWFPELDCLHPITWGSDCCQILSLWDNFNNSCVLRGRRTKRRI